MRLFLALLALTGVLSGCESVTAYTKIESDGSFVRTVRYSQGEGSSPSLSDFQRTFYLPQNHPGVSYRLGKDDKEPILTTSRRVSAGHPMPADIVLNDQSHKPIVQCQVVVQKLADGDVAYDETIHWLGPQQDVAAGSVKPMSAILDKVLPDRYRTKEYEDKVGRAMAKVLLQTLFGPPYPHILDAVSTPDLFEIEMSDALQKNIEGPLKEVFPDMSDDERRQVMESLLKLNQEDLGKLAQGTDKPHDASANSMGARAPGDEPSLLFVVKPPGAVVETNGTVTSDGHVYWSLYKQALPYGDVKLHLVAHVGGSK